MSVQLVRPDARFEASFRAAFDELETQSDKYSWIALGESKYQDFFAQPFTTYVHSLLQRETVPPSDFVPDTKLWAVDGGEIVGRISLRHELNEFLAKVGGHIGFTVRPSRRRQGIGTQMLHQILLRPEAQKIRRLLLTCDEGNAASERTILKNGGKLSDILDMGPDKVRKKRFWIDLGEQDEL